MVALLDCRMFSLSDVDRILVLPLARHAGGIDASGPAMMSAPVQRFVDDL